MHRARPGLWPCVPQQPLPQATPSWRRRIGCGTWCGPRTRWRRGKCKARQREGEGSTKAITEIYLTRLLSVKVRLAGPVGGPGPARLLATGQADPAPPRRAALQQFVDLLPRAGARRQRCRRRSEYFFDFLDEQAEKHDIRDEDTVHIWKTNRWGSAHPTCLPAPGAPPHALLFCLSLPLRFWVNILKNPHFIFDVRPRGGGRLPASVIAQTFWTPAHAQSTS